MSQKNGDRAWLFSILLSLAVHGLLFAGLITVFRWQTSAEYVYAELWAPEDVSAGKDALGVAEKTPSPEPKSEHQATPEPDEPSPDEAARQAAEAAKAAQAEEQRLAQEAQRAEEARLAQERAEAERIEQLRAAERIEAEKRRLEEARKEKERLAQEKLAQEKRKAEEARKAREAAQKAEEARKAEAERQAEEARKAEAARKAAEKAAREERERLAKSIRDQELARLNARFAPESQRSGVATGDKTQTQRSLSGTALARYHARVAACIRPNITYDVPPATTRGQFVAVYQVKLDATQRLQGAPLLVKPSGLPAYDAAVERAIRRCNPFPKPEDGYEAPSDITLTFDPIDDKR